MIDERFAETLLGKEAPQKEKETLALLMRASRGGDLCIEGELSTPVHGVVSYEKNLYLQRSWDLETTVLKELNRLLSREPLLPPLPETSGLYPKQSEAYHSLHKHPFFILSGGPGCGKTYLAQKIIDALFKNHPKANIVFTAPTAKAANRILDPRVVSKTLHSLLGIKETFDVTAIPSPIVADLLIIDECSMIDIKIFSYLLRAISIHTPVLFMGDPNQLPPIESAGIFYDLCQIKQIPHIHLNETKRTHLEGLQKLASLIATDCVDEALSLLVSGKHTEIALLPLSYEIDPSRVLLTPFNKGPFGTKALNALIEKTTSPKRLPIIITKNDYRLGLSNGDTGYIEGGIAYFNLLGKELSYSAYLLFSYEIAFALSIHKSQGSEFDHVSLLLPEGSELFGKEMIYTAITRAKKSLRIYSTKEILQSTLKTPSRRKNNLIYRTLDINRSKP